MCPKCQGTGRYITEPFAGAWKVNPCDCQIYSKEEFNKRIQSLREKWSIRAKTAN
jgi:uncharacterized membrane protein